jgi:hypothetical protein
MVVRDHLEEAFELKAEGIPTEADGLFDPQSEYSSVGSRWETRLRDTLHSGLLEKCRRLRPVRGTHCRNLAV